MSAKTATAIDKAVADKIRTRRIMIGLSQQNFAPKLGVTFQQVQKYENGTNRISVGRLHQIATALRVPLSYFFEGIAQKAMTPAEASEFKAIQQFVKTKDGIRIARALLKMPVPVRRSFVGLAQQVVRA